MSEWKPIESAPCFEWVLVRGGSTEESLYSDDPFEDGRPVVAKYIWREEGWFFAYWDGAWRSRYYGPTEWMEIPE